MKSQKNIENTTIITEIIKSLEIENLIRIFKKG